ncbi:hypothetical protein JCM19992_18250 [Thermostilla marina]
MKFVRMSLALAIALAMGQFASADIGCLGAPNHCAECGRNAPCQKKVCRIECGTKTITKHCWCVEEEDMCTMLPRLGDPCKSSCTACGEPGCGEVGCEAGCSNGCEKCGGLRQLGCKPDKIVPPKPGRARTTRRLVKKEYTIEVPVYKTVVEYVCGACGAEEAAPVEEKAPTQAAPEPAPLPKAPEPADQAMNLAPLPPL